MVTPSQQFYGNALEPPSKVKAGLDKVVHSLWGEWKRRAAVFRQIDRGASEVERLFESEFADLDAVELSERILQVRAQFLRQRKDRKSRIEALACLMRVCQLIWNITPYHVQITGAIAIDRSLFAEMATGEGKTLTIGLAGVLAGWSGKPCHIITSNDYLAERDSESMRELYSFCKVSVGFVIGSHEGDERVSQYQKDVVYTTSQQLLADHLKSQLAYGSAVLPADRMLGGDRGVALRSVHSVIIDEADNILIDEAVTPLIISHSVSGNDFQVSCSKAKNLAHLLEEGADYRLQRKYNEVELTAKGKERVRRQAHVFPAMWRSAERSEELVKQAITARHYFIENKHYVIDDGKVEIVDESTGRIMPGRTWKQGLQQAIEAKEGLAISDPTETLSSMSFQRFFRSFPKLSGVSGTAWEARYELWHVYELSVFRIPTHRPNRRITEPLRVFPSKESKLSAVVEEVAGIHQSGRPILVGTRSVQASERISQLLDEKGLEHSVLNAVRHQEEAEIVADAGGEGCITISTNMAGRGTDISIDEALEEKGGLFVIVAECNMSPRIDRQLVGRAARQGEAGSSRSYLCSQDEVFTKFLSKRQQRALGRASSRAGRRLLNKAQKASEKLGAQQRASMLMSDSWTEENLSFTRAEAR
ncbi:MAG: DEAD/DEAH box helicase [Verrucomicrobiota bacterium]